jgi:hypothetical protein
LATTPERKIAGQNGNQQRKDGRQARKDRFQDVRE